MKKYLIIEEPIEARTADVISEAYEQGLQNGYFKAIAETESMEEARKVLAKNTIEVEKKGKHYEAILYYLEEQEYDEDIEEWETDLDSLEFADVINNENNDNNEEE